jgi:hypothetical protein
VDENEIEVLEAGVAEGLVDLLDSDIVGDLVVEDFGGEVDIGARNARGLDGGAARAFIAVEQCGIDVSVSDFQGVGNGTIGLVCWALYCS